jgi:hypothetical protein
LPVFTDVFVGGEALEGFESSAEVVGRDKGQQMLLELIVVETISLFDLSEGGPNLLAPSAFVAIIRFKSKESTRD